MTDKPFSLEDDVKQAFERAGLRVLNYQRERPNWIRLTVDAGSLLEYQVGVAAISACSLAVDVRHVVPLGRRSSRYSIELEVDDRTTIHGQAATEVL